MKTYWHAVVLSSVVASALFTGGCATNYRFKVDAVRSLDPIEEKQSYQIVSASPEMDASDLRFQEAARYVKTALSSKGMFESPPGTGPDLVIEVDFGMEEPKTRYRTVSEPEYITTAGYYRQVLIPERDPATGTVSYRSVMVYEPGRRELIGFIERNIAYTVYEKYMRITARETPDAAGDRPPREVWSVYVSNDDEQSDLRAYVPLMVSAAMDSINQSTTAQKEVVLSKEDERIEFVKKGL